MSFLEPLLRNSSEHRRNYMVIKNLILRANLQVSLKSCSLVAVFLGLSLEKASMFPIRFN